MSNEGNELRLVRWIRVQGSFHSSHLSPLPYSSVEPAEIIWAHGICSSPLICFAYAAHLINIHHSLSFMRVTIAFSLQTPQSPRKQGPYCNSQWLWIPKVQACIFIQQTSAEGLLPFPKAAGTQQQTKQVVLGANCTPPGKERQAVTVIIKPTVSIKVNFKHDSKVPGGLRARREKTVVPV